MLKQTVCGMLLELVVTQANAGVAVSIGQPGFYGQIFLGNAYPAPQVIYPQPVVIQPPSVAIVQPPLYLRIPPGHMRHWRDYCGRYGACGRQVYFVQDQWYQHVYAPRYNARHDREHERWPHGQGWEDRYHGKSRGHDRD